MKKIALKTWLFWMVLALVSLFVWLKISYPRFAAIDLSVNRAQAIRTASEYIEKRGATPGAFRRAVIFSSDDDSDRYLQRNLGFVKEKEFLTQTEYSLFYWIVRFFKENEKEEYSVYVSSQSGRVISFRHTIEDVASRPASDENSAKDKSIRFLTENFRFDPQQYTLFSSKSQKYENRTDYNFIWQKNDVNIPWKDNPEGGGAKLLAGVTISGDEILHFTKEEIKIPDGFTRYIDGMKQTGNNLTILFQLSLIGIIAAATFFVVSRKNHLVLQTSKKFYIKVTIFLFALNLLYNLSEYQSILYYYETTSSLVSYIWQCIFSLLIQIFFLTLATLMPGMAGETLRLEIFPEKKEGSFSHYLRSTFFSRGAAQSVVLGYLIAAILIGLQAVLFQFGQKYFGVWLEEGWLTQLSSSNFPFFASFVVAFQASFDEEVTFRMFGISWFKKYLKSTWLAILIPALTWGFGHTQYLVFPMWFRGMEVMCMGIFLGIIYLRYGLICVLVAHYLFDAFWGNSAYLLSHSNAFQFAGSLCVLFMPLGYAGICFVLNRTRGEQALSWHLNPHQKFNLNVLMVYLREAERQNKERSEILRELIAHGWDMAIIETAQERLSKEK